MSKRTIVRRPKSGKVMGKKPLPGKSDEPQVSTEEPLQLMFLLAGHWKSDLDFFRDELNFFRKLIDKYFIWLVDEKNIESTRTMVASLVKFDKTGFSLNQRIDEHKKHLTSLIENPFPSDGQKAKKNMVKSSYELPNLSKTFVS